VSTAGGIVLSRKGVRNAATQREIEDAYQAGLAVEGNVEKQVKGGYEVRIARERAFCPLSQIDIARTADPDRSKARDHLLGLFAAVGNDDPRVLAGRRNLASALF